MYNIHHSPLEFNSILWTVTPNCLCRKCGNVCDDPYRYTDRMCDDCMMELIEF